MERARAERERRRFAIALAAVTAAALALRVVYVLRYRSDWVPEGDAFFYHGTANLLADGRGFVSPFFVGRGITRAAAEHPPLYSLYLAVPSLLGMRSVLTHLLWSCAAGSGTVALVGLTGRKVAGPRAGLVAAALAAVYPNLLAPDGQLQAESLAMLFVALSLLLAYRYRERPGPGRLAWVGVACGLAALTRSELVLLLPALVIPLAARTRGEAARRRVVWLGVSLAAAVAVLAPWSAYNLTRFTHPEVLSAQFGPLLSSANCDSTYSGSLQGYFDIRCTQAVDAAHGITLRDDESVEDSVNRRAALDYVRGHLGDLPRVEGVRLLRIVGLYKTSLYVHADYYIEGRSPLWLVWAGLYGFWALAVLSFAGAVVLHRRRAHAPPLWPLVVPVVVMFVTVLLTYASTRFRTTAEPAFVVLAAVALDAAVGRVRGVQPAARN